VPVSLVVRTWNLYHGRTHPETRRTHLRRMVELVTEDRPDVVAFQEVPLWALGRLERWSGMAVRWAVTVPSLLLGPLARVITELNPVRLRSLLTGQANALLLGSGLEAGQERLLHLNPGVTKWQWLVARGPQRRYCQAVEVTWAGPPFVVANLHATNEPRAAGGEVERAADFVADAERCVLVGDFNAPRFAPAGFSGVIEGIDQILVRGLEFERPPAPWEPDRRRLGALLLSDHAPVEAVIA
jgi:endonuclease/exonuclease/phosphatase family metal-dependent hydrolase